MTTKLLHVLTLFAIAQTAIAQEYNIGSFVSLPVGEFASEELADGGGFASTGWGSSIEIKARRDGWPKWLYAGVYGSFQYNDIDDRALTRAFNEDLGIDPNTSLFSVTTEKSNYSMLSFNVGPIYRKIFLEKLYIDIKTGFGILFSNSKPANIKLFGENNELIYEDTVVGGFQPAFNYSLGLDVGYSITNLIGVNLFINYSGATIEAADGANQKINSINPGVSISIKL